jgi:hypothetical protein
MHSRKLAIIIGILMAALAAAHAIAARQEQAAGDTMWTSWDAAHYFLIEDGGTLWIGTGSGLLRYTKTTDGQLRIATPDGLPHRRVFCGALDGSANRWFGGDGGLSRLDAAGQWTHFNRANSGLAGDQVTAIAVTTAGDIWISYVDQATITRRKPDGSWQNYPNRETAVSLAFDNIKQTVNHNELWTAAGGEVWAGYQVFDGAQWQDRTPENAFRDPQALTADSQGHLWAIGSVGYEDGVLRWDGKQWLLYEYRCDTCFNAYLSHLAVGANGEVWVGGYETYPYSRGAPGIGRLPDQPGSFTLGFLPVRVPGSIAAMLATGEGLWVTGPSWLARPNWTVQAFEDVPFLENARRAIIDGHGTLWLHSGWYDGVLQTLDDAGTGTLQDDSGNILLQPLATAEFAVAANGDLWVGWVEDAVRFEIAHDPRRYIDRRPLDFTPPVEGAFIRDIYVEDARHTWFVFEPYYDADQASAGIWRLDDGGTPANQQDDVWTTFELEQVSVESSVAARDGMLWYGDATGVYRYRDGAWQQLNSEPVQDLIPARGGLLFAQQDGDVLVIEADGRHYRRSVPEIVLNHYTLVRSTTRRNELWRNTPDGAIWYWHLDGSLGRWDGRVLRTYESPVSGGSIEVDARDHIWLIESPSQWQKNTLWRISPQPDFSLTSGPAIWFITPDGSREFAAGPVPIGGYTNPVQLSLGGLPSGVTAVVSPSELLPGELATITLTAGGALGGKTTITLRGVSGDITHEKKITLDVVEQARKLWLPTIDN